MTPASGDGLDDLLKKYGPVVNLRVLWSDLILTTSPEHIKTILATDFQNYVKGNAVMALNGSCLARCLHIAQDRDFTIIWRQCWELESSIQTVRPSMQNNLTQSHKIQRRDVEVSDHLAHHPL